MAILNMLIQGLVLGLIILQSFPSCISQDTCLCKPLSHCAGRFQSFSLFEDHSCDLGEGRPGVCCTDNWVGQPAPPTTDLRFGTAKLQRPPDIVEQDIKEKIEECTSSTQPTSSTDADGATKAHRLFASSRESDEDIYEAAQKLLNLQDLGISIRRGEDTGLDAGNSVDVNSICPWTGARRPKCTVPQDGREYRTVDGSCNNRRQPLYGMSGTPFERLLFPEYSGGQNPRKCKTGAELPNARLVTTTVLQQGEPTNSKQISELFIQFGQFLDHDLILTPVFTVDCCRKNSKGKAWLMPKDPKAMDNECVPIRILSNDTFWGPKGRECMEVARNKFAPTLTCRAGAREQANSLTHWFDLSNVYGSTEEEYLSVRDPVDRRLLRVTKTTSGGDLPPSCPGGGGLEACMEMCKEASRGCFYSGDPRINEQPGLAIEHLQWIREHNRVARELSSINPKWDHEKVFLETRRIVTAEYQHIIYNEWAPLALGSQYMEAFNLLPLSVGGGYTLDYDDTMDPRITNEFAAAAFRFGHSMIRSSISSTSSKGRSTGSLDLKRAFNKPNFLRQLDFIENSIRGTTRSKAAERDSFFSENLMNHLLEEDTEGGLDLMSINIQRGRERGVPGYNSYRELCASGKFGRADSWDHLAKDGYINAEKIRRLKTVYRDVEDIDLFVGGVLEEPHRDSVLGPTFKCIVGDQLVRLKRGDRFWYEHGGSNSFTLPQLNELRKASIARVLCDNFKLEQMQPLGFLTVETGNGLVNCRDGVSIPRLDLQVFKETVSKKT